MRSKHWVIYNPEIMTEVTEGMKYALRHIPHFREWFRFRVYWFAGDGLFPSPDEITLSCSCPDWADMCKHVAAVLYGVGARLDQKPEHLFLLRGVLDRFGPQCQPRKPHELSEDAFCCKGRLWIAWTHWRLIASTAGLCR